MNLDTYLTNYTENGGSLEEFAKKAGMSRVYLNHIRRGRKTPGMKKVAGIIYASDGQIPLRHLCKNTFPPTKKGKDALAAMKKSISL